MVKQPPLNVCCRGGKVFLEALVAQNKKVAKDTMLAQWTLGEWEVASGDSPLVFTLMPGTLVYAKAQQTLMPVKKLVQSRPLCTSLFGHDSWPLGTKGKTTEAYPQANIFALQQTDPTLETVFRAVTSNSSVVGAWVLAYDEKKTRFNPVAWALVAAKQINVPGGASLEAT